MKNTLAYFNIEWHFFFSFQVSRGQWKFHGVNLEQHFSSSLAIGYNRGRHDIQHNDIQHKWHLAFEVTLTLRVKMLKKWVKLMSLYEAGMGEIGKVGNLDLKKFCIGICFWDLVDLNKYCISLLENSLLEVRNVEIDESIQFDTNSQQYLFEKSQNNIIKCFSSQFAIIYFWMYDMKLIFL